MRSMMHLFQVSFIVTALFLTLTLSCGNGGGNGEDAREDQGDAADGADEDMRPDPQPEEVTQEPAPDSDGVEQGDAAEQGDAVDIQEEDEGDAVIPPPGPIEGYGYQSAGGAGGDVCRVTTLSGADEPGSLKHCLSTAAGPRTIVFDVGGTIELNQSVQNEIVIRTPYITVDGSTAPSPGITISTKYEPTGIQGMIIAGTHDVIVRYLRFVGPYIDPGQGGQDDLLSIDADTNPDHVAYNVVLDHLTLWHSTDGAPDIAGEVHDVTVSWCFTHDNFHPTTITYDGSYARERISLHHNVYAFNDERQPQIRYHSHEIDIVNHIVYDWDPVGGGAGYGIRIRYDSGYTTGPINILSSAFIAGSQNQNQAIVYGDGPGGGDDGTVQVWTEGNYFSVASTDGAPTIGGPFIVPAAAQVTTYAADELSTMMVPLVGTVYRTPAEQAILDQIAASLP